MSDGRTLRVLLVDDQILFVESLKCVLEERAQDLEVVGVAHDGNEAIFEAMKLQPDIILMDVRMPKLDGVQATRKIHELYPRIKILMLTTFADEDYVEVALKFGAIGYLLKNISPAELIESVRAVKSGITQISPEVVEKLLGRGELSQSDLRDSPPVSEPLTRREQEILELMLNAYENKEIAEHLSISEQTVKNHIHSLYEKLRVSNRLQLMKVLNRRPT